MGKVVLTASQIEKHRRVQFVLLILLIAAQTIFIFGNSMLDKEDSKQASLGICAFFKRLLDPQNRIDQEVFHHYIRKLAHFTEFGVLGALWNGTVYYRARRFGAYTFIALFAALFTAVCDEFLQSFTGRGSMVSDVLIDFSGGVCGIAFAAVLITIIQRHIQKRKESPS